jgi:hypothetical protein
MRCIKKRSTFIDAILFGIHCIVNQMFYLLCNIINSIQTFTFNFIYEKDKNNYVDNNVLKMALSLNCKEAGDPVCTHTMYGDTEEELLANAKKHGIEVHGYTEETWNEEVSKNLDHFRKLIKTS